MPGEIKTKGPGSSLTCYFRVLGSGNAVWSVTSGYFEIYTQANWSDYATSLTEQGNSNTYVGNFPSAIPAGVYDIDARRQAGGSPAFGDAGFATGELEWNGSKRIPLSDLLSSGQFGTVRLTKGVAISGFPVYLKSSADHITPFTSGVVSGQISRNGGSFVALQSGVFAEVGLGFYKVNFTSGDLNADVLDIVFTANGISGGAPSDPYVLALITQIPSN